jgi:hypothetical protein
MKREKKEAGLFHASSAAFELAVANLITPSAAASAILGPGSRGFWMT